MKDKFSQAGRPPTMSELEEARKKRERDEAAKRRREEQARDDAGRLDDEEKPDDIALELRRNFAERTATPATFYATPATPRRWLIEGILPANETTFLIGAGGAGKGHLLMNMAMRIAGRIPFASSAVPNPGRVLWVSLEDGLDELHRRFLAAVRLKDPLTLGEGQAWRPLLEQNIEWVDLRGVCARGIAIDDPRFLAELEAKASAVGTTKQPADLIILDPLGRMLGDINLNSQDGAGRVHAAADFLVRRTGATALVVHHVSKAGRSTVPGEDRGAGASSGSHILEDLARAVLRVVPMTKQETRKRYPSLDLPSVRVSLPKGSYVGETDEVVFTRREGGALQYEAGLKRPEESDDDAVLEVLAEFAGGATIPDWREATMDAGVSKARFQTAKRRLEDAGKVTWEPGQGVEGKAPPRLYRVVQE